jgi:hypothetical protein
LTEIKVLKIKEIATPEFTIGMKGILPGFRIPAAELTSARVPINVLELFGPYAVLKPSNMIDNIEFPPPFSVGPLTGPEADWMTPLKAFFSAHSAAFRASKTLYLTFFALREAFLQLRERHHCTLHLPSLSPTVCLKLIVQTM